MRYLDVEMLREAICRVGNWLSYIDRDLDSPEATTLIALVYERLIRGKVPGSLLDLLLEYEEEGEHPIKGRMLI